jgi:hypothetical protein
MINVLYTHRSVSKLSAWNIGRLLLGASFVAASIFNILNVVPDPQSVFRASSEIALFPWYADLVRGLVLPNAAFFAWLLVLWEGSMGLLILSRGVAVKIGLLGYTLFLVGITPAFGVWTLMNGVLWLLPALFLRRDYPTSFLDLLLGH